MDGCRLQYSLGIRQAYIGYLYSDALPNLQSLRIIEVNVVGRLLQRVDQHCHDFKYRRGILVAEQSSVQRSNYVFVPASTWSRS